MSVTIDELFQKAGWEYKASENYYLVSCPNKLAHKKGTDRKPSCVVWPGIARFKCYSCGFAGDLEKLFDGTGLDIPEFLTDDFEVKKSNFPLDSSILHFRKATVDDLARPAFADRNWNPQIIDDFDLRFDDANDNLVFPVYSPELVGAVGRSATGKKVHNYFGFFTGQSLGGFNKLTANPKIAVVEGWTCLVNAYYWANELGFDIVCTFTANISQTQCRMLADTGKTIHFWFDQDKAGQAGLESAEQYIDDIIFAAEWDSKFGDIGNMSREVFFKVFSREYADGAA